MAASQASVGGYRCNFWRFHPQSVQLCGQRTQPHLLLWATLLSELYHKNCWRWKALPKSRVWGGYFQQNNGRGCEWKGKVEQLDTHSDLDSGDCQYIDVECPEKCMWSSGSETSTGHSCCKQVFQVKLHLHALWIQSYLRGCQWETLARVPELLSIMP